MNKDVKDKWLRALRSGEYKQGRGKLLKDDKYCCLGVLCDLYAKETHKGKWSGNLLLTHPEEFPEFFKVTTQHGIKAYSYLPGAVVKWSGLEVSKPIGLLFVRLNDVVKLSFPEIAQVIEDDM